MKRKREKVQSGAEQVIAQYAQVVDCCSCGVQDFEFERNMEEYPCAFEERVKRLMCLSYFGSDHTALQEFQVEQSINI